PAHPCPGADVRRPLIGITIGYSSDPEFFTLRDDYLRAVEKAEGLPVVLAPGRPDDAADLLSRIGGLRLPGGAGAAPGPYCDEPRGTVTRVTNESAAVRITLCREILRKDGPPLATCRGHQVLCVATGATLI